MHRTVPVLLLAAALGAVAALVAWDLGTPGADGTFPVTIIGPGGELWNGSVEARDATAYSVLVLAADEAGLEVEATGSGQWLFVVRIGAYENEGASGWCYAVWEDGWATPDVSAGIKGLHDGQAVLWAYEKDGCADLS